MVLSAVTGAATWQDLDLAAALRGGGRPLFNHTLFLGTGKCTEYPGVVHQYIYGSKPYTVTSRRLRGPAPVGDQCTDSSSWHDGFTLKGFVAKTLPTSSPAECCAAAAAVDTSQAWTYDKNNTCTVYSEVFGLGGYSLRAKSAMVSRPVQLSDFTDLAKLSCLNGWTMGNIAVAPKDAASFFLDLGTGRLLNHSSLKQMLHFEPLTQGFATGTPYWLGMMLTGVGLRLDASSGRCKPPLCVCKPPSWGGIICSLNATVWSHAGMDWGSAMPHVGWIPELGISFSMAFNSYGGMNTSLSNVENNLFQMTMFSSTFCKAFSAVLRHKVPELPAVDCSGRP